MKENEENMQTLDKRRKEDFEKKIFTGIERRDSGTRKGIEKDFLSDTRTGASYAPEEIPSNTANASQGEDG